MTVGQVIFAVLFALGFYDAYRRFGIKWILRRLFLFSLFALVLLCVFVLFLAFYCSWYFPGQLDLHKK